LINYTLDDGSSFLFLLSNELLIEACYDFAYCFKPGLSYAIDIVDSIYVVGMLALLYFSKKKLGALIFTIHPFEFALLSHEFEA